MSISRLAVVATLVFLGGLPQSALSGVDLPAGYYQVFRGESSTGEWIRIDRDGGQTGMTFLGPNHSSLRAVGMEVEQSVRFSKLKFLNYIALPMRPGNVPEGLTISRDGDHLRAEVKARSPYSQEPLTLKPVSDDRTTLFDLYRQADNVLDASGVRAMMDRFYVAAPRTSVCPDHASLQTLLEEWAANRPKGAQRTRLYPVVRVAGDHALVETMFLADTPSRSFSERRLDCLVRSDGVWRFASTEYVAGDRMGGVSEKGYTTGGLFLPRAPGWTMHVLYSRAGDGRPTPVIVQFSPALDASMTYLLAALPEGVDAGGNAPTSFAEADLLRLESRYLGDFEQGEILEREIGGKPIVTANCRYRLWYGPSQVRRYYHWTEKYIHLHSLNVFAGSPDKPAAALEEILVQGQWP